MRIQVGNELVNIRQTGNTLWYPRREASVMQKMDTLFERTAPNVLQWDASKPKVDNVEELINPNVEAIAPFRSREEREEKAEEAKELDFPTEE